MIHPQPTRTLLLLAHERAPRQAPRDIAPVIVGAKRWRSLRTLVRRPARSDALTSVVPPRTARADAPGDQAPDWRCGARADQARMAGEAGHRS